MPIHLRFRLAGIALTVGGLTAGTCHLFSCESSSNVTHLALYAHFAEPLHLLLFASLILVLLGWFEQYSLLSCNSGVAGFAGFVSLFLGILCGDLLHSILEFSVFPVLGSMVPYALPGIAEATYHSAALGNVIWAGRCLIFLGGLAAAASICRSRFLPLWVAAAFALSASLSGLGLFPQLAEEIHPILMPSFYTSIAGMGVSFLRIAREQLLSAVKNPSADERA